LEALKHEMAEWEPVTFVLHPTLGAEIQKTRPAIVVSGQPFTRLRRTVVVVPLSSAHTESDFPLIIAIKTSEHPKAPSVYIGRSPSVGSQNGRGGQTNGSQRIHLKLIHHPFQSMSAPPHHSS
jgi:hypothetical protein